MGILEISGHLGTFVTLVSGIRDAGQSGFKFYKSYKLESLRGTVDFSSLSEELAPIADRAERYLAEKKSDVLGNSLFSSEEKAEFIEDFFKMYSDTLAYRSDVEKILLDYVDQLESCLLQQMSIGERVLHSDNRRVEENTKQLLQKVETLASCSSTAPYASPDTVSKKLYDIPSDYIPRKVVPHAVAMLDIFERAFQESKSLSLTEALAESNQLLILSDAGHGKSIELENLAGVLSETSLFPFLYSLSSYCGETICALLPEPYRALPPESLALLFDGYDEMQENERDEFMRRLQSFLKDHPSVKVVISSRSNFCKAEVENQSQTFRGFRIYDLDDLTDDDIRGYLSRQAVDIDCFMSAVKQSETGYLLQNPFYLIRLVRLYQKHSRLPGKAEVMDYLIEESFQFDDQKFQGDLEEQRRDLRVLLEKVAFAMQLMQKSALDDAGEYQELFGLKDRKLLKYSGLLRKEGTRWRFSHNNFKEYLAAKFLSALPQEDAIRYFSDEDGVKMSWVNTFGFFVGIPQEWNVIPWTLSHDPSALVKFEPDHLELDVRVSIFKTLFLEREEKMLCPGLSKAHLRAAMERQFQAAPSSELMAHLISLGSKMALLEYIKLAEENQTIPEKRSDSLTGPTQAISTVRDPKFLPLLEKLMETALSPDFQDGEFCSLRTSLSNALTACGAVEPDAVKAILRAHQGTPEKNECAFWFCSYTEDALRQKIRMKQDAPLKLSEVKRVLETVS